MVKPLLQTFDPSIILDGELYVHGWPLQRINAAVTPVRLLPTEDTVKVEYHVFDVVDFGKSFERRYWAGLGLDLLELKQQNSQIQPVYTSICEAEKKANQFYAQFVSDKYEGMMYRLGDCPYTVPKQPKSTHWSAFAGPKFLSDKDNRVWHLLKRKDWQDHEFICLGVQEGEGKLTGTLGALICSAARDGAITDCVPQHCRFSVGSGLTDSQRDFYWRNPPIGKLIKVKYLCLSSDGIPLNPTIHPDHIIS